MFDFCPIQRSKSPHLFAKAVFCEKILTLYFVILDYSSLYRKDFATPYNVIFAVIFGFAHSFNPQSKRKIFLQLLMTSSFHTLSAVFSSIFYSYLLCHLRHTPLHRNNLNAFLKTLSVCQIIICYTLPSIETQP